MKMKADARHELILDAAVKLAKKIGYRNLKRVGVAEAAGVSKSCVSHYFEFDDLREAVVQRAIRDKVVAIVAQALGDQHADARRAVAKDPELNSAVSAHFKLS